MRALWEREGVARYLLGPCNEEHCRVIDMAKEVDI